MSIWITQKSANVLNELWYWPHDERHPYNRSPEVQLVGLGDVDKDLEGLVIFDE